MKPENIAKAYDQITHLWDSDEFDMSNGIAQHHKALSFVKQAGKALDIGCGCTGRFIELLLNQGFTPTGLDLSGEMLKIARRKHPQVEFVQGDICQYELSEQYDFITAWDSIWHVPLTEQRQVISKIVASLRPGGVFIFSCGGTEQEGSHTDQSMGPEVYYSTLGIKGFLSLLIGLNCLVRHVEFDQYPQLHCFVVVEKIA